MKCPNRSDLVAWIVAPDEAVAELREHVEQCQTCQESVRLLRQIIELACDSDSFAHSGSDDGLTEVSPDAIVEAACDASQAVWLERPRDEPSFLGTLGDFDIVREIGRGGMGIVYEANQLSLGRRRVAVKVLPMAGALDPHALLRFQNEARTASLLQHEHIVPVYAFCQERGIHFYAMQYIEGCTIAKVIADMRRVIAEPPRSELPSTRPFEPDSALSTTAAFVPAARASDGRPAVPSDPSAAAVDTKNLLDSASTKGSLRASSFIRAVARLGFQIADALQHAHDLSIVHRDIKPSNLMLDLHGKAWLTDFGLAHVVGEPGLTLTGHHVGTLRYMAPEQSLPKDVPVDRRADIYSLGATLYELLTLRPVCEGTNREELLRHLAFHEPTLPRRINSAIPVPLETIVMKSVSKNPDDRYQSARQLADDLQRYLDDRPIVGRRPNVMQRLGAWSRRHKGFARTAIAAVVATFLISLATTFVIWGALASAQTARDEAVNGKRISDSYRLAFRALLELGRNPGLALGIAIQGRQLHENLETNNALIEASDANHELVMLHGHQAPVRTVSFSQNSSYVVTAASPSDDKPEPARVWDGQTGVLRQTLQDTRSITSAVLSPNGTRVLASVTHPSVGRLVGEPDEDEGAPPGLWDALGGSKLVELQGAFLIRADAASFSPDGRWVVTPARGNTARIYDVLGNGVASSELRGHTARVLHAAFSPQGTFVVTTSLDKTVRVWNARTGEEVRRLNHWRERAPRTVAFDFAERLLATGSLEGAHLWSMDADKPLNPIQWQGDRVRFSPRGDRLLVVHWNGREVRVHATVRVSPTAPPVELHRLEIPGGGLRTANIDPRGRYLALAVNHEVRIHDLDDGTQLAVLRGHDDAVTDVIFDTSGDRLASTSGDKTARIWHVRSGKERSELPVSLSHRHRIALAPQSDRAVFATGPSHHTFLVDPLTGESRAQMSGVFKVGGFVADRLATVQPKRASIWEWGTQREVANWELTSGAVRFVRLSRNGERAAVGMEDGVAWLWDLATDERIPLSARFGTADTILDAVFSHGSDSLAIASSNGTIRLWQDPAVPLDAPTELRVDGKAKGLEFSRDGRRLLSISDRNEIHVWDLDNLDQHRVLGGADVRLADAHFGAEGNRIVSFDPRVVPAGTRPPPIRCWDTATGQMLRELEVPAWPFRVSLAEDRPELLVATQGVLWWNFESGETRQLTDQRVALAVFGSQGDQVVTVSNPSSEWQDISKDAAQNPTIRVLDLKSGREIQSHPNRLGSIPANAELQSLPDGRLLMSATRYGAEIVDPTKQQVQARLDGMTAPLSSVRFGPNGQSVGASSLDGTAAIWSAADGKLTHRLERQDHSFLSAAFHPKGDELALAGADGQITLWKFGSDGSTVALRGHSDLVLDIGYSPQGDQLVSNSADGTLRVWNREGETLQVISSLHGIFKQFLMSSRGGMLAVPGVPRKRPQHPNYPGVSSSLAQPVPGSPKEFSVQFHPTLASSAVPLKLGAEPRMASFSPDGSLAVTVDIDGETIVWHLNGQTSRRLEIKPRPKVESACISPGGDRLLVAQSSQLSLWDLANGHEIATYPHAADFCDEVESEVSCPYMFSPDGHWILARASQSAVRPRILFVDILRYARQRQPRELTAHERAKYVEITP